jgi:hypothetical protein
MINIIERFSSWLKQENTQDFAQKGFALIDGILHDPRLEDYSTCIESPGYSRLIVAVDRSQLPVPEGVIQGCNINLVTFGDVDPNNFVELRFQLHNRDKDYEEIIVSFPNKGIIDVQIDEQPATLVRTEKDLIFPFQLATAILNHLMHEE